MAEQDPLRTPDDSSKMTRVSRTGAFWLLLVLMVFLMVQLIGGPEDSVTEFTYTEFRAQLDAGNISEVTVVASQLIEGELSNSYIDEENREFQSFRTMLPGEITEELLADLEQHNVEISGQLESRGWGTILVQALPWVLFIAFWIWILRTFQGGGNRAFQFGRSKAKMISPEAPKVTFADIAGADEAKHELEEVIEFLKDPQRFSRLGGRLPKGVLLVGPPGTGKTLLARAVAGEASRPFFQMSGSDFVEMFVGVGASRVRDLFEQGKAQAPCIIFIDEIDAVGRHRGAGLGGGHDEREQTLNQLLVEMDGFAGNDGVIVIAATNRPDVLDLALLRPGRFDRQFVVPLPDVRGREQILRVHMRKVPIADDVRPSIIARGTPGMSGADLANLVNEAALFAARANHRTVGMEEFEKAKDKIMMGTERRSMVMSEKEKKLTAFHEAGHALVGRLVPQHDPVYKVSIIPRGRALGITMFLPEEDKYSISKLQLESQLASLFGGRVAEEIVFGSEHVTTGASNDIERATNIARNMVTKWGLTEKLGPLTYAEDEGEIFLGRSVTQTKHMSDETARLIDEEVRRIMEAAHQRALELVESHLDILHLMADALIRYETIDSDQIDQIMEGHEPDPPEDWDESDSDSADQADVSDTDGRPTIGGPAEQV